MFVTFFLNEQVNFTHNNNEISSCFGDDNVLIRDSWSSFSAFEMNFGVQQYVDGVSARQMEEPKASEVNYVTNDELIFPFSSSNNPTKMDTLRRIDTEDGIANIHKNVVERKQKSAFSC